jgi:hypothetical protein
MGPRCSSAETQVCHRSYIIAAKVQRVTSITKTMTGFNMVLPDKEGDNFLFFTVYWDVQIYERVTSFASFFSTTFYFCLQYLYLELN